MQRFDFTMVEPRKILVGLLILPMTGCTYGPEEERAAFDLPVQFEDSYNAVVAVRYERYREPTGLSAFPDGGKRKFLDREGSVYLLDSYRRTATSIFRHAVSDSLWESFRITVAGLEGDTVAQVVLSGCPRGGECHPVLTKYARFRVRLNSEFTVVERFPQNDNHLGVMAGRRIGETNFVRLSRMDSLITGRFEEDSPNVPLFAVQRDGTITPIGEDSNR